MARYIDVEKFADEICNFPAIDEHSANAVILLLRRQPTADVAEVKHGHWIYQHRHRGGFELKEGYDRLGNPHMVTIDNRYETDDPYCSICGKLNDGNSLNYCSNCGAKMDGRSDTE